MKYKAFYFQVSGSSMVQVDSAKDYSHWVSVFDGLCKIHWFSCPSRQMCISHKATVTLTLIGTLAGILRAAKN